MRSFFDYLEEKQLILMNPAVDLKVRRERPALQPVPTEAQVEAFIEGIDTSRATGIRDRAFVELLYGCAARRAEMMAIRVGDVDFEAGTVLLRGKGSRERVVPIGRRATEWLKRYLGEVRPRFSCGKSSEALWLGARGRPLSYQAVPAILRRHGAAVGMKISPHALRRACATHMLRGGAHPVEVQMLLGHADLRHLGQYLRVSISELKAAHSASKPGQ